MDDELDVRIAGVELGAAPEPVRAGRWSRRTRMTIPIAGVPTEVRVELRVVTMRPRDPDPTRFRGELHDVIVERLRTSPVASTRLNKGGGSLALYLDLEDRTAALYKPGQRLEWTSPRKEVATYRLDRLLGLNAVPPCVLRALHRDELVGKLARYVAFIAPRIELEAIFDRDGFTVGSAALWIPDTIDLQLDTLAAFRTWSQWLTIGEPIPAGEEDLAGQLSSMLVLDRLTNNFDRFSGGGILVPADGDALHLIDNSIGFQPDPVGDMRCASYLSRCQRFRGSLIEALRRLDATSLARAMANPPEVTGDLRDPPDSLLTDAERDALLARAARIVADVDALVRGYGEATVLAFP